MRRGRRCPLIACARTVTVSSNASRTLESASPRCSGLMDKETAMRNVRIGLLVVVAVFFAGAVVMAGLIQLKAAGDDVAQEARDRHEIEALMWRYARALDSFDPDAYASAATPHGHSG